MRFPPLTRAVVAGEYGAPALSNDVPIRDLTGNRQLLGLLLLRHRIQTCIAADPVIAAGLLKQWVRADD